MIKNYEKIDKLGEGTYGIVYKAIDKRSRQFVAIKVMRLDQEEEGISSTTLREIAILTKMSHPNIVSLIDVSVDETQITIVLEYLHTDIRKYMKLVGALPPNLVKSYAFQLLCGVYYLHTHRVMHRDLKPENLLIDQNGYLKICDFGLSRFFTIPITQYTEDIVTLWYRPPEILLHNSVYDISVDIWSVGCIIAEIATRKALFPGDSVLDEIHKIFSGLGTPNEDILADFHDFATKSVQIPSYKAKPLNELLPFNDNLMVDLVSKMLVIDPKKRISAKEALDHPYFANITDSMRAKFLPDD